MVRGRRVRAEGRRSLTQGEITDLKGQKQEAESTLKYIESNPGANTSTPVDKSALKRQINKYDAILSEGAPPKVRGTNKDGMAKRAEELRGEMRKNMPTRDQMNHPATNPGAVQKHLKWTKLNDPKVREYKEIMRRLEPDDPTAMSVESLRKDK